MAEVSGEAKAQHTQWATQLLAPAELVSRSYTVSFTMGNSTPIADLMAGTPNGEQFWADVKGLPANSDWLVKPEAPHKNLFYVLIYLSQLAELVSERRPDQFHVLTQDEANNNERTCREAGPNNKITVAGFRFGSAEPHRDR